MGKRIVEKKNELDTRIHKNETERKSPAKNETEHKSPALNETERKSPAKNETKRKEPDYKKREERARLQ